MRPGGPAPDAEVLVVGGGPAGSSTALRLARRGLDVLLVDAATHPRSKPCGDCLSPGADPLLRELGVLDELDRSESSRLRGWRLRTPGGRWFGASFGGGARGLGLPRRQLDARLLGAARRAGVTVQEGVRVFDLLRHRGRIVGVRARGRSGDATELRAEIVVGADGLRSAVARRLAGVRRGPRRRLAVVGRFQVPGGPGGGRDAPGRPVGRMRLSREGCLGTAPLGGDRWNVTLVIPSSEADRLSRDRGGYFRRRVRGYGAGGLLERGRRMGELEVTGPFEVTPRRRSAPGCLLVGDAAGYFDPLTGQGIYRALTTGRMAARAVHRALAAGRTAEAAAFRRYEDELDRRLRPSRRVQRVVDHVVARPAVVEAAGRLLASRPALTSLLLDVTGDRRPARHLLNPRRLGRSLLSSSRPAAAAA